MKGSSMGAAGAWEILAPAAPGTDIPRPAQSGRQAAHMRNLRLTLLTLTCTLLGCATTASLPQSPSEVVLDPSRSEQGYWPRYTASATIESATATELSVVAKSALTSNQFTVVREDPVQGVFMGEHGTTAMYWNVMAGIYLTQKDRDVLVQVVTVGSKDIGFVDLAPSDLPKKILDSFTTLATARTK